MTASAIGIIIAVVAVLLIHIDRNAVVDMNPIIRLHGAHTPTTAVLARTSNYTTLGTVHNFAAAQCRYRRSAGTPSYVFLHRAVTIFLGTYQNISHPVLHHPAKYSSDVNYLCRVSCSSVNVQCLTSSSNSLLHSSSSDGIMSHH